MFAFSLLKRSRRSRARLGLLRTSHGAVETPALVAVATQASIKALTNGMAADSGVRMVIANTLHLHLKPGEGVIRKQGGIHRFMGWQRPVMTDSGGYQVFSLGFGLELGIGKVMKKASGVTVTAKQKPKLLKITEEGVHFTSYLDGRTVFLGPKESMKIQGSIGADIVFAFDECPPPVADKAYMIEAMERTHRWAKVCLKERGKRQALFGIVQGGKYADLRRESAKVIAGMPFHGFGIGGEFGADKASMSRMLRVVTSELPDEKPRHLLGIGHPEDIRRIIKEGVDTFDCTVPTHYARNGVAFTSKGRLDMTKSAFLRDGRPLDGACSCFVCRDHSRAYLSHLVRSKEMTASTLLTFHNLHFFNALVAGARDDIRKGRL